jgi:hypothetical protein
MREKQKIGVVDIPEEQQDVLVQAQAAQVVGGQVYAKQN